MGKNVGLPSVEGIKSAVREHMQTVVDAGSGTIPGPPFGYQYDPEKIGQIDRSVSHLFEDSIYTLSEEKKKVLVVDTDLVQGYRSTAGEIASLKKILSDVSKYMPILYYHTEGDLGIEKKREVPLTEQQFFAYKKAKEEYNVKDIEQKYGKSKTEQLEKYIQENTKNIDQMTKLFVNPEEITKMGFDPGVIQELRKKHALIVQGNVEIEKGVSPRKIKPETLKKFVPEQAQKNVEEVNAKVRFMKTLEGQLNTGEVILKRSLFPFGSAEESWNDFVQSLRQARYYKGSKEAIEETLETLKNERVEYHGRVYYDLRNQIIKKTLGKDLYSALRNRIENYNNVILPASEEVKKKKKKETEPEPKKSRVWGLFGF